MPGQKEKFENLLRVAEEIPKDGLNMGAWLSSEKRGCGTVACLGGWAALDPWFNDQGLICSFNLFNFKVPKYRESWGYGALSGFFGVSMEITYRIFDPSQYKENEHSKITVDMVIDRIEGLGLG